MHLSLSALIPQSTFRAFAAPIVALMLLILSATGASAYENTIRIVVEPSRLWQCGDGFFANGGSETYRIARIYGDGRLLGSYDLADPAECGKQLEHFADLPAGGTAVITVEVGGYKMDAAIDGADRNRIWTVKFFVDAANGELTEDFVPARQADTGTPAAGGPPAGLFRNTIDIRVAKERLWQCGDGFFANGGSPTYQFGRILVDGAYVTTFDFARLEDCTRVETVARDLPDGGKSVVTLEVGPYTMNTDIAGRDRTRTWTVQFFVDQIWGEVSKDGE